MTEPSKQWLEWLDSVKSPPIIEGETDDERTDRIHKLGYEQGRRRQCSIGWHDECSDRQGDECACPCHKYDKGQLIAAIIELEEERASKDENQSRAVDTASEFQTAYKIMQKIDAHTLSSLVLYPGRNGITNPTDEQAIRREKQSYRMAIYRVLVDEFGLLDDYASQSRFDYEWPERSNTFQFTTSWGQDGVLIYLGDTLVPKVYLLPQFSKDNEASAQKRINVIHMHNWMDGETS